MPNHLKKAIPVVILAIIGLAVSGVIDRVHQRLAADVNYTSFCNVSAGVNCDVVLGSPYAVFAGVAVSRWALLYFALTLVVGGAVAASRSARWRQSLASATVALAAWGLLFAGYMAVIALVVLGTVCLLCSTLYVVNIGLFVSAWHLRSAVRIVGRRQQLQRSTHERWVVAGALAAVAVLVAIGSWEAFGRSRRTPDAAEIERERPEFYRWYVAQPLSDVHTDSRPSMGSSDAAITIVEFSDFECGHCAAFHQSLEDVLRRGTEKVRVVFRHFPLDSACNAKVPTRLHPQACLAAIAAECALEQGKFWEYHNLLFDNQQQLGREFLIGYAARLGLDTTRFSSCLSSDAARERVQRDAAAGAQLGIDSTPTVFINGRTIKGALDPARLVDALVLARAGH
jgi:protein-disulfide isomerase/uncharacterized membrane protein